MRSTSAVATSIQAVSEPFNLGKQGTRKVRGTDLSKLRGQVPKGPAPAAVQKGLHPQQSAAEGNFYEGVLYVIR